MRKRSSYRAKPINANAHEWALQGVKHIEGTGILIKQHEAMKRLEIGSDQDTARVIVSALNATAGFSLGNIGSDWHDEIEHALMCMGAMCERARISGTYKFKEEEIGPIWCALGVHEAQLQSATVKQLETALNLVTKTISLGKARKI